jgi:hypothetical protein
MLIAACLALASAISAWVMIGGGLARTQPREY